MLGLASSLVKGGASLLTYVKDNLKLYLDFKSNRSDALAFPSEGSTSFDASTEKITVGQSNSIVTGNEVTLSCWFKSVAYNSERGYLIQNQKGAGSTNITLQIHGNDGTASSGYIGGLVWNGSSAHSWTTVDGSVDDGKWHHVAFTSTATTQKVYLDGVLKATETNTFSNSASTDATIIGNDGADNYPFDGKMANVAIWNRVLSPEEVQSVMNKSYSQLGSVEKTSLVSWWAMDNSSDRGADFWDVGVFTQEGSPTTSTYSNGLLNVVGNGNNTGARFSFPSTGSTSLEGYNQYEFSFDIKITSGGGSSVKIQHHYAGAISSTFNDIIDTTEAPNQEFKRFVTTLYNDNSASANRYFVFVQNNASPTAEFQVKNVVLKPITANDSKGSNHGQLVQEATTTTSVYGGNAPILPRAIDIAESQAEQIGDGSALFNGTTDIIDIGSNSILDNVFVGGATLTAWINPSSDGENSLGRIFDKSDSTSGNDGWHLLTSAESGSSCKLRFAHGRLTTIGGWDTTNTEVNLNEWTHVAVTYNNSSTDNNATYYINGISVAVTEFSAPAGNAVDDSSRDLFIGNNTGLARTFDGSIASAGIWQGELTQSQIQSVMESTSYAKIPASVKSTLGANTLNPPTSSSSEVGWNTDTEVLTFTENRYALWDNATTKNSTLYKFQYEILTRTAGGLAEGGGSSGWSFGTLPDTVGVHTIYKVSRSDATGAGNNSDYLQIQCTGFRGTIGSISMKEVINDLVAFYPLDADSSNTSSLGITNDSVGGETLGINLIDSHNKDRWISEGGNSDDDITNGVQLIFGGGASGNYAYINDALLSISGLASDTLYKTTFTASYSGGSSAPSIRFNDGTTSYDNVLTTTPTEYEVYFQKNGSAYLQIVNQVTSNVTDVINWTIKEVTSNTGVLK